MLLYSIFPDGNTLLHMAADKSLLIEDIFKFAHNEDDPSIIKHEILFIPNMKGESPIDIALRKANLKTVDLFLKYLGYYGVDHHSRALNKALPLILAEKLQRLHQYIDTRIMTNFHTEKMTRGKVAENESSAITYSSYKLDPGHVETELFKE